MIYTNAIEEAIFSILMQCDDQLNEIPMAYTSQRFSDDEFKYSFIEKHDFALVKVVEKSLTYYQVFTLADLSFREAFTLACQYLGACFKYRDF
jgi:hypothetical protein